MFRHTGIHEHGTAVLIGIQCTIEHLMNFFDGLFVDIAAVEVLPDLVKSIGVDFEIEGTVLQVLNCSKIAFQSRIGEILLGA